MILVTNYRGDICTQKTDGKGIIGGELTEYSLYFNDVVLSKNFKWVVSL